MSVIKVVCHTLSRYAQIHKQESSDWHWQALRWFSGLLWSRVYPFWQYWQWRPAVWWRHFWHTPPLRRPDCWNTSMLKRHLFEWPLHSQAGQGRETINTTEENEHIITKWSHYTRSHYNETSHLMFWFLFNFLFNFQVQGLENTGGMFM